MNFPNIPTAQFPVGEEKENNQLISQFEDGTQQIRRKFTRRRRTWHPKWNCLRQGDYDTLMAFLDTAAGLSFFWTVPGRNETVEVICTEQPEWENFAYKRWRGGLTLAEV